MVALIVLSLFGLALFLSLLALRWRSKVVLRAFIAKHGIEYTVLLGGEPDEPPSSCRRR